MNEVGTFAAGYGQMVRRRLLVKQAAGPDVRLRIASDTDIDGAANDRSQLKLGMKISATYQVPQGFNAALGYDVIEMIVE